MRRLLRVVCFASFILASPFVGCSRNPSIAPGVDPGQTPASEVRVYVTNRYEISLEIYVAGNGAQHRLGLVNPGQQRMFLVPRALVGMGSVEFQATPTGYGPTIRSEELELRPGHVVDFEITTNLIGSRATIRL